MTRRKSTNSRRRARRGEKRNRRNGQMQLPRLHSKPTGGSP